MSIKCTTPKELAEATKNNEDCILIEGDLKNKVIRIKAVGTVAWGVCGAALVAAIAFYIATPAATVAATPVGGTVSAVVGTAATAAAATTLGTAATTAVAIGVSAGGIGALNTLRDRYRIVEKDEKHILLKRK